MNGSSCPHRHTNGTCDRIHIHCVTAFPAILAYIQRNLISKSIQKATTTKYSEIQSTKKKTASPKQTPFILNVIKSDFLSWMIHTHSRHPWYIENPIFSQFMGNPNILQTSTNIWSARQENYTAHTHRHPHLLATLCEYYNKHWDWFQKRCVIVITHMGLLISSTHTKRERPNKKRRLCPLLRRMKKKQTEGLKVKTAHKICW